MRILIASDLHWPTINGIATFGDNLATGLTAAGHEVLVVAPSQTGKKYEEQHGNYRITRTSSLIFPFYQNLRVSVSPQSEIKKIAKQFRPDIIHLQTPLGVGMGGIAAARKFDIPLVATNHAMSENLIDNIKLLAPFAKPFDAFLREFGSRFYSNADYVTLPTMAAINMLKPDSFTKPYKAISNGIDLSRFTPGPARAELRERYGIPGDVPIVMYLGRLDAEKHISVLVRAAHRALEHHQFHLVIVGFGNDLDHLEDLVEEFGMQNRVTFTGRIDEEDKADMLRLATIFAMPSPAELQSISTLEAMAVGVPVVVVNAGALYELCQDGRNGYLYPIDDVDEMSNALTRLLADPALAKKMGQESLAIAQTHDLGHTIQEFEALYAEVIKNYQPRKTPAPATGQ